MDERDVVTVPVSDDRGDGGWPPTYPLERTDVYVHNVLDAVRVLIVAGIGTGVVVAGLGSRLAMLLLRVTSADAVNGIESDDGFTIGQVTVGGTYNLFMLGAFVGIIGAAAYQWVRPWLLGPTWFQRLTLGAGAGAVVGSMLIHADGVDFVVLRPTWLAITVFIALPALFGVAIGPVVDRVARPTSWTARHRIRWVLPLALVVLFPLTLFVVVISAFVIVFWFAVRPSVGFARARHSSWTPWVMRAFWLGLATLGLAALIGDVTDIAAIT